MTLSLGRQVALGVEKMRLRKNTRSQTEEDLEESQKKKMSELRRRQAKFAVCLAKLILFIDSRGWEITLAEGYVGDSINKPSEDTPHLRTGTHFTRTGQDINLFVGGIWKREASKEYIELGEFWKSLDPLCFWGGDLASGDFNHFSIRWGTAA